MARKHATLATIFHAFSVRHPDSAVLTRTVHCALRVAGVGLGVGDGLAAGVAVGFVAGVAAGFAAGVVVGATAGVAAGVASGVAAGVGNVNGVG